MVIGFLILIGCSQHQSTSVSYWKYVGEGPYDLAKDYKECRGPVWRYKGWSPKTPGDVDCDKAWDFCVDAELARRKRADSWRLWSSTVSGILDITSTGLAERCMATRGCEKAKPVSPDSCMKNKGYIWEEAK